MSHEKLLAGRVVVLTGAAEGLGRAFVVPLLQQGALLVLNDIKVAGLEAAVAEARALGGAVAWVPGNVADWNIATKMIETAMKTFGRVDALINNAAIHYVTPSQDDTPQRMREIVEVNVLGTLFPGVAALREMVATGKGGVILNVGSGAAMGLPFVASYAASKGAIPSLTYAWAQELRDRGIRVNCLAPTALTQQVRNTMEFRPSAVVWGPEKTAPLVIYLLSDLSRNITGQVIRLWGDDLHLVSHPQAIRPSPRNEAWTIDSLDAAFREQLHDQLQPYGRDMDKYIPFPG
jgi:NAD(P)-dependent dehydrogenase (short-subunit alcohol dehydrogenase family)